VAALLVVGGGIVWEHAAAGSTTSCSWPLRVRGHPWAAQAGLVRCYLRALAHRDPGGLLAVAQSDPPVRITPASLTHAADANAGLATADFQPNPEDNANATVTVTYADGARQLLELNDQEMTFVFHPRYAWRVVIGFPAGTGSSGPPPARQGPPPARIGPGLSPSRPASAAASTS